MFYDQIRYYKPYDVNRVLIEFLDTPEYNIRYISPDDIYDNGYRNLSFIYLDNGEMLYGSSDDTHSNIIYKYKDLIQELYPSIEPISIHGTYKTWQTLNSLTLLGRVGIFDGSIDGDIPVVAFWANNKRLYDGLLKNCLNQLHTDNIIDYNTYVSTPLTGTVPQNEIYNHYKKLTPEEQEKLELAKNLHLMRPNEKKAAMLKLGLNTSGSKHKYQKAAEDNKLISPGQKWWATTSEEVQRLPNYDIL